MGKKGQSGQATLEFVLVMPVLIIFILVVSQFGHMVYVKNILEQASREAARTAATTGSRDEARQRALKLCSGLKAEGLQINVMPPDISSLAIGDFVQVEVSYRYGGIADIIEVLNKKQVRLRSKSIMRAECVGKEGIYP
ncbi:MAG: TadE/TadG family type IV pilus assembly protein [Actinomycetota bacterium]